MSCLEAVSQWEQEVSSHLPHLSKPQARLLALWSFALVVAHRCGSTTVAVWLARCLGGKEAAWRQRLREWYCEAEAKKGAQRRELVVASCFGPLLRWVLAWWPADEHRLALALDASTLSDRFTVLCLSVLVRGCAVPVAWSIVPTWEPGAWKPRWLALLDYLADAVPADWLVVVLADRGLYAHWLYRHIQHLGWHPFLRINAGGKVRPRGGDTYVWLRTLVPSPGTRWSGGVSCFTEGARRLECTLVACWEVDYTDPWFILTDLLPEQAESAWYGMRAWIEGGFKDTKRGGWQWHQTKMTDPRRAERLWLVLAVATLWVVSVGSQAEAHQPVSSLEALPVTHIARRLSKQHPRPPALSWFTRGVVAISVALVRGELLLLERLAPFAWPSAPPQCTRQRKPKKRKTYP